MPKDEMVINSTEKLILHPPSTRYITDDGVELIATNHTIEVKTYTCYFCDKEIESGKATLFDYEGEVLLTTHFNCWVNAMKKLKGLP